MTELGKRSPCIRPKSQATDQRPNLAAASEEPVRAAAARNITLATSAGSARQGRLGTDGAARRAPYDAPVTSGGTTWPWLELGLLVATLYWFGHVWICPPDE